MKTKQDYKKSLDFLNSLNQATSIGSGRTFDRSKKGKETNTNGEYWLSFGKVINDRLIRDGSEMGYAQYMSICIDNFDEKAKNGSANNAEWDALANCQNSFIAGILKVRDTLEPGQSIYKHVTKDLAYQIRRRNFEAEANKHNLEALAENNENCEGWS